MGRKHIWYYLKDDEGKPISNASINLYLHETSTEATVYSSRSASAALAQSLITTNSDGYFEFYIGDQFEDSPDIGYTPDQYFDLYWTLSVSGITGFVDELQLFEKIYPVDETTTDAEKNKMVSNELAYKWDYHVDRTYVSQPHVIEPVDSTDPTDGTVNKVVSNELMNRLYNFPITSGGLTIETSGALFTTHYLYPSANTPSGDNFARDYDPELQRTPLYPVVQIWEQSTGDQIIPVEIRHIDNNLVRVIISASGETYIATSLGETGA